MTIDPAAGPSAFRRCQALAIGSVPLPVVRCTPPFPHFFYLRGASDGCEGHAQVGVGRWWHTLPALPAFIDAFTGLCAAPPLWMLMAALGHRRWWWRAAPLPFSTSLARCRWWPPQTGVVAPLASQMVATSTAARSVARRGGWASRHAAPALPPPWLPHAVGQRWEAWAAATAAEIGAMLLLEQKGRL